MSHDINPTDTSTELLQQQLDTMSAELESARSEIATLDNNYKRALADYKNLEQRSHTQLANRNFEFKKRLFLSLLEILDTLEMSSAFVKDAGLELIKSQINNLLRGELVVETEVLAKPFDPSLAEVVEVLDSDRAEHEVLEVVRKGYTLEGKLLRVALVKVSSGQQADKN